MPSHPMQEEMLLRSMTTYLTVRMFVSAHLSLEREVFSELLNEFMAGWSSERMQRMRYDIKEGGLSNMDPKVITMVNEHRNEINQIATGTKEFMLRLYDQFKRDHVLPGDEWKQGTPAKE